MDKKRLDPFRPLQNSCITDIIVPELHKDGKQTTFGAVDDLAVNSSALQQLVSTSPSFSTYAIAGITQDPLLGYDPGIRSLWRWSSILCGIVPGPDSSIALFAWEVFNSGSFFSFNVEGTPAFSEVNDRIVSQSSQLGGLSAQDSESFIGFDHITIHDDASIVDQVKVRLDEQLISP